MWLVCQFVLHCLIYNIYFKGQYVAGLQVKLLMLCPVSNFKGFDFEPWPQAPSCAEAVRLGAHGLVEPWQAELASAVELSLSPATRVVYRRNMQLLLFFSFVQFKVGALHG